MTAALLMLALICASVMAGYVLGYRAGANASIIAYARVWAGPDQSDIMEGINNETAAVPAD